MPDSIKEGYIRVSDVLEPFSGLEQVNPDILQIAADRGTVIHHACDCIVQNLGLFDLHDQVRAYCRNDEHAQKELEKVNGCIESFKNWYEKQEGKFHKINRLYLDSLMITGEIDFLYESSEGLTLLDIKTSSSESLSWLLQGSCYSWMLMLNGYDIKRIEFLKLSRTGGKAKSYFYQENFPLFLSHLQAYNYSFKDRKKMDNLDFL